MNFAVFFNAFHKAIRSNRIAAGLTQADLAIKANVSVATIKRIEAGGSCGLKEVARILAVLNPKLVDRLYQALAFDPLDFTDDPVKGFKILSDVKSTKRVRGSDA